MAQIDDCIHIETSLFQGLEGIKFGKSTLEFQTDFIFFFVHTLKYGSVR